MRGAYLRVSSGEAHVTEKEMVFFLRSIGVNRARGSVSHFVVVALFAGVEFPCFFFCLWMFPRQPLARGSGAAVAPNEWLTFGVLCGLYLLTDGCPPRPTQPLPRLSPPPLPTPSTPPLPPHTPHPTPSTPPLLFPVLSLEKGTRGPRRADREVWSQPRRAD